MEQVAGSARWTSIAVSHQLCSRVVLVVASEPADEQSFIGLCRRMTDFAILYSNVQSCTGLHRPV